MHDTLAGANASFRRGVRVSVGVLAVLIAALVLMWVTKGFRSFAVEHLTHRSLGAWIGLAVILGLLLWMVVEALRSSRTVLTSLGIERDGEMLVRWSEITVAEYARGWVQFTTLEGRTMKLSLIWSSATNPITEAVQDHLPAGVRLRVH